MGVLVGVRVGPVGVGVRVIVAVRVFVAVRVAVGVTVRDGVAVGGMGVAVGNGVTVGGIGVGVGNEVNVSRTTVLVGSNVGTAFAPRLLHPLKYTKVISIQAVKSRNLQDFIALLSFPDIHSIDDEIGYSATHWKSKSTLVCYSA